MPPTYAARKTSLIKGRESCGRPNLKRRVLLFVTSRGSPGKLFTWVPIRSLASRPVQNVSKFARGGAHDPAGTKGPRLRITDC